MLEKALDVGPKKHVLSLHLSLAIFFGATDLNAITPDSSPAYSLQTEHPSGQQYVNYLKDITDIYSLKVNKGVNVHEFDIAYDGLITLYTSKGEFRTYFLIWAGGEAQYPKTIAHTVRVERTYNIFPKGYHVIIGGAESGMDAAYNLVKSGSTVSVLDSSAPWNKRISDSSYGLSPYTFERLRSLMDTGKVELVDELAEEITENMVRTRNRVFKIDYPAIDATGFDIKQSLAGKLFYFTDGHPKLTDYDESTKYKNVYLVGPNVRHEQASFCFIYKYRQRFAVVVRDILSKWDRQSNIISEYADRGFLLDNLSCCKGKCEC